MIVTEDKRLNCRFLLIDGLNIFIRSWVCDPSLSIKGNPVGGLIGFLKVLQKLVRETQPSRVVVAWDGAGGSRKRKSIQKDYKAGRKPVKLNRNIKGNLSVEEERENMNWQQFRLLEYLNDLPIYQFVVDGSEADDVIAYIVKLGMLEDCQKVIASSDKDFIQLVDSKTILYRPTQKEILTVPKVVEKFGIHPNNFSLARAIAGDDKTDNIQGVESVGLRTIANRFPEFAKEAPVFFDELQKLCEVQQRKKLYKTVTAIMESAELIKRNYKLVNLVPAKIDPLSAGNISDELCAPLQGFSKHDFLQKLIKDGCGDWNFEVLFQQFKRIIFDDKIRRS